MPARRAADYEKAKAAGKIASFIAVEGGVGLENSLSPLRIWHAAGVRLMTLCHNETLDWVDSATDAPRNGGLNAFGRAVIGELNRLGIVIDLAHVSHDGMRRVLDATEAPVALSHSNAFTLCDHPRNAPDDVLRAPQGRTAASSWRPSCRASFRSRCGTGSGAGATPTARRRWPPTRRRNSPRSRPSTAPAPKATLEEVADHIERLAATAGIDHVGDRLGLFRRRFAPQGLENVSRFPHLFAELVRRGFSERDLVKMSSGNMLRVLRRVEAVGKRLKSTRPPAIGRIEDYPGA